MKLWIKVCGNTSLADARLAVEAGADALGFVFAPSSRRVTAEEVAGLASELKFVETIGVFVDAPAGEIVRTVELCRLTGVQLHGPYRAEAVAELRTRLGRSKKILRVAHYGPQAAAEAAAYFADANVDGVLIDSRTATATGGTGTTFDWAEASQSLFGPGAASKCIAAGGLTPENVAEALRILRPAGVDVASGVEVAPGRKDPKKVKAFVEQARAAALSLGSCQAF